MTEKKRNVDQVIDIALSMTKEDEKHLIEPKAEALREVANRTINDWMKIFSENGFHKSPVSSYFIQGMLTAVARDIETELAKQRQMEQLMESMEKNPDLKGN